MVLGAVACAQGFDRRGAVSSFEEANPEVSTAQAECVVDRLIERFGLEGLSEQLDAESASVDFEEAQFRDMFACGVDGDVTDQIVDQLIESDVPAEQAPCVADALVGELTDSDIDVLLSGTITDEFFAKFFDAMESCGAVDE